MHTICVHKAVNAKDFVLKAQVNYFEVQFYENKHGICIEKKIWVSPNWLTHGKNSVIMNSFSLENVDLFPEFTVGVVK